MRTLAAVLLLSGCGSEMCTDAPLAPCSAGVQHHNLAGAWSLRASQTGNRCGVELDKPLVVESETSNAWLKATAGALKLDGWVDANGTFDFWSDTLSIKGNHVLVSPGHDELRGGVQAADCERWQFVGTRD